MSMNPKMVLPPEVFAKFEQAIAELKAGKRACPRVGNAEISIHACFGCEFGHMAGCHYPKNHGYGVCGHKGRGE